MVVVIPDVLICPVPATTWPPCGPAKECDVCHATQWPNSIAKIFRFLYFFIFIENSISCHTPIKWHERDAQISIGRAIKLSQSHRHTQSMDQNPAGLIS
jgi:hypothetical protein